MQKSLEAQVVRLNQLRIIHTHPDFRSAVVGNDNNATPSKRLRQDVVAGDDTSPNFSSNNDSSAQSLSTGFSSTLNDSADSDIITNEETTTVSA